MRYSRKVSWAALLLMPVIAFRVALSQSDKAEAWVTVKPDTGGFSVLMPEKPALETEQAPIAGNKYETITYTASEASTGNIYLVITQETPTLTQVLGTAKRMDQFVEGFKEGFGSSGRLSSPMIVSLRWTAVMDASIRLHMRRRGEFCGRMTAADASTYFWP